MKTKTHAPLEIRDVSNPVVAPSASLSMNAAVKSDTVAKTEIREVAYKLFEERGRVDGYDLQDWLEAEIMLRERGKVAA
jgi:Protein of unknown function (DUF2934)